jgi:hypothetical protein
MKSPTRTGEPGAKSKLEPAHVDTLYKALEAAGFGGMRIASLHLIAPERGESPAAEARECHAELQPDGSYKIVCG